VCGNLDVEFANLEVASPSVQLGGLRISSNVNFYQYFLMRFRNNISPNMSLLSGFVLAHVLTSVFARMIIPYSRTSL